VFFEAWAAKGMGGVVEGRGRKGGRKMRSRANPLSQERSDTAHWKRISRDRTVPNSWMDDVSNSQNWFCVGEMRWRIPEN